MIISPEHWGYCFNSNSVKTQYAAVNDVITQYKAVLGMGVLIDRLFEMENFRSALKAAGIDDVIAENQETVRRMGRYTAVKRKVS